MGGNFRGLKDTIPAPNMLTHDAKSIAPPASGRIREHGLGLRDQGSTLPVPAPPVFPPLKPTLPFVSRAGLAALIILAGSAVSLAASEDPDPGQTPAQTDIRRQLLSEFKYVAPPKDAAAVAPFLSDAVAPSQSAPPAFETADLVKMDAYTVQETVQTNSLHAVFLQQKANARMEAVMTKLGVAVHVAPVGKAYVFAATIFYIPFAVGFGFSF
jgi:hypothetical protein